MSKIVPMQGDHLRAVARLHASALAGDFLPSLGDRFLQVFYHSALRGGLAAGFVNLDGDGAVSGFVLGCLDSSDLFRSLTARYGLPLGLAALPAVLRQPGLLRRVTETFLYPSKEKGAVERAELLVIAVNAAQRSHGLGACLVQELDGFFRGRGVNAYKVTVLQSNQGANRFYRRLGFQLSGQFRLYGKEWNLYRCRLI